jgi:hypothetical protein
MANNTSGVSAAISSFNQEKGRSKDAWQWIGNRDEPSSRWWLHK